MSLSPLEYLRHIVDEAEYLTEQAKIRTKEEFLLDETVKRAFVRSLEIIGEATKKVPTDLKDRYLDIGELWLGCGTSSFMIILVLIMT